MRELTYYIATTLDGRIAGPGGDFSAFATEGDHMPVLFERFRDTLPAPALDALGLEADGSLFDTTLMGWNTYAVGLGVTDSPYPHTRQVVFSRTRDADQVGTGVELTDRDPRTVVQELKQQPGTGIWLCGGGLLAGALADQIDQLVLKVNPVAFLDGPALFSGDYEPQRFALTASTSFESGVVLNEYRRA